MRSLTVLEVDLDDILPSWLVRLDSPPSSRDPLGLQAHSQKHADDLLPGLNVFTSRARYYSFLCWAIRTAQRRGDERSELDRLHRLERLLVLCEALRHEDEPDACRYIGWRRGRRYVSERRGARDWELPSKVLKNQGSNGAFRLYRTSLVDLELIEEEEVGEGLGVRLTNEGERLAECFQRRVADDTATVRWAIEGIGQRKRRDSLLETSNVICLSGKMGGSERRYLIEALFSGSPHGLKRRETARILFQQGLLSTTAAGEDIVSEDADAITEDGGEVAAQAEVRGNWSILSGLLRAPALDALRQLRTAATYQLAQLGLNAVFAALLRPVMERGRIPLTDWQTALKERGGAGFAEQPALSWMRRRPPVETATDLLAGRDWREEGTLGLELLLQIGTDDHLAKLLAEDKGPLSDRVLMLRESAERTSAASLLSELIPDLVHHHQTVSARKGKGEWMTLDDSEVVKVDPRPVRLMIHALRLAQLGQLASDLELRSEDVADDT